MKRVRELRKMPVGIIAGILLLIYVFDAAGASEEVIALDRIVVVPYRYAEEITKTPASVEVISQEDITDSNAQTIADALRPVTGIVVRDWFNNAAKASVDIRGFGELGAMNVLVLIDGRRVNEIDLSGTDWTQIPLNQVEKIEVIRGGAGSVLYGDNAVSGVINIITKKGKGKPAIELETQVGSFDMNKQRVSLSGLQKELSYSVIASREGTHGYRENSYYKAKDFATKINYDIAPQISLRFSNSFHDSGFGLPGALLASDLEIRSRRDSKFPRDHAGDKDYYFVLGATGEFPQGGELSFDASFRRKEVFSNFIDSAGGWFPPFCKSRIDTLGFLSKYILEKSLFGLDNKVITGIDFYRSDYASDNYDIADTLQSSTDANKISTGYYLQDEISILKRLIFAAGYRYEFARYEFYAVNPDADGELKPERNACNTGLVYKYKPDSALFFNINRSFRFPAVDEYFTWGTLNPDLKPQVARNYEAGIRHRFNPENGFTFSLFRMNIESELYYNPLGGPWGWGANENYDKTRHEGLEFSFDFSPLKNVDIFANYAYTKSFFRGGIYEKKIVPMVPRYKASLGLKFILLEDFILNIRTDYVGKRYFINDQANAFSGLKGYVTADTNLSYQFNDFKATLSVNNIFNEMYSEYGVIGVEKAYYPACGRNFNIKMEYKF
jgi:iron complex outermembrane receptor protein